MHPDCQATLKKGDTIYPCNLLLEHKPPHFNEILDILWTVAADGTITEWKHKHHRYLEDLLDEEEEIAKRPVPTEHPLQFCADMWGAYLQGRINRMQANGETGAVIRVEDVEKLIVLYNSFS